MGKIHIEVLEFDFLISSWFSNWFTEKLWSKKSRNIFLNPAIQRTIKKQAVVSSFDRLLIRNHNNVSISCNQRFLPHFPAHISTIRNIDCANDTVTRETVDALQKRTLWGFGRLEPRPNLKKPRWQKGEKNWMRFMKTKETDEMIQTSEIALYSKHK